MHFCSFKDIKLQELQTEQIKGQAASSRSHDHEGWGTTSCQSVSLLSRPLSTFLQARQANDSKSSLKWLSTKAMTSVVNVTKQTSSRFQVTAALLSASLQRTKTLKSCWWQFSSFLRPRWLAEASVCGFFKCKSVDLHSSGCACLNFGEFVGRSFKQIPAWAHWGQI